MTHSTTIDASSVDFGHTKMNEKARGEEIFNVAKYPTITYRSTALKFDGDKLVGVDGEMTLLGITKPMPLTVTHFKCIIHPLLKREVCGADAHGRFDRSDFGMNIGLPRFSPEIKLAILWLNANTRTYRDGMIQGPGWQLVTTKESTSDLLDMFECVRHVWLKQNKNLLPRTTSYKLVHKQQPTL
mgnify:CR=1 FL=1